MSDTTIVGVDACEVLDSRGRPTVSAEVILADGSRGEAAVPSGASIGRHEAIERRDGGTRYGGFGVRDAVRNVVDVLGPAVIGRAAADQADVDRALRATDDCANLATVGSNAVLAVSVATALAAAAAAGLPLFALLADAAGMGVLMPMPMVNVLSGGAHAGRLIDIQDVLVIPLAARSFAEAIEIAAEVRRTTAECAEEAGHSCALVADEGGLGLAVGSNRGALDLLIAGIERAGMSAGAEAGVAIDVAASQLVAPGGYRLGAERRVVTSAEWLEELRSWVEAYPIVSLEDPLAEDAWQDWAELTKTLGSQIQLVGDDLFATNPSRLARGIDQGVGNAILVKPNQIGTLSDALTVMRDATNGGYATIVSARSGETEDSWLADLAVGLAAGQIKVGSTMRSERTAKWNRLLRIEHALGADAVFACAGAVASPTRPRAEHGRGS